MSTRPHPNPVTRPLVLALDRPSHKLTATRVSQGAVRGYGSLYQQAPQQQISIQQRAAEIAPRLHPAECRVLMDAVAPLLFSTEVYTPPHGEPEHIAQSLASHYGLLVPERLGYASGYRPTLLGVAVIWRCLLDDLQARPGGDAYVE